MTKKANKLKKKPCTQVLNDKMAVLQIEDGEGLSRGMIYCTRFPIYYKVVGCPALAR